VYKGQWTNREESLGDNREIKEKDLMGGVFSIILFFFVLSSLGPSFVAFFCFTIMASYA
jgi:hypothetical protein